MAFLNDIFGGGAVASLGSKILDTVNKFVPDTNAQAAAKIEIEKMLATQEFSLAQGQQEINKIEAGSSNLFVSGWRPAAGWTCVMGLFYTFLLYPFLVWASSNFGLVSPPALETGVLLSLLSGLLGLGTIRMNEKIKGVAAK